MKKASLALTKSHSSNEPISEHTEVESQDELDAMIRKEHRQGFFRRLRRGYEAFKAQAFLGVMMDKNGVHNLVDVKGSEKDTVLIAVVAHKALTQMFDDFTNKSTIDTPKKCMSMFNDESEVYPMVNKTVKDLYKEQKARMK
jgi:hypothetical protein